jgi:hypothetical protein
MLPRSPLATTTGEKPSSSSSSSSSAAQPLNDVKPFKKQQLPIMVVKRRSKLPPGTRPTTRAKYAPTVTTLQQQSRWSDNKNQAKNNAKDMSSKQRTLANKQHLQVGQDDNGDQDDAFASYDGLVQTWATTLHDNNPVTMSDTALALQSLVQSSHTCLEIPLAVVNHGGATTGVSLSSGGMIRGVLECQLQNLFQSPGTSTISTTGSTVPVSRELDDLVHARHVTVLEASVRLNDAQTVPLVVYIDTRDYIRGVQAAKKDGDTVTSATATGNSTTTASLDTALWDWFVSDIVRGTGHGRVIRHEDLVQSWTSATTAAGQTHLQSSALESWLRQCQTECNVLRVADSTHTAYQWWLPAWGAMVVPAFARAAQRVVRLLKQTTPQRQLSLRNVTTKLQPRSPISIANLVLPWLVSQGIVQCISRPSGMFVQLC